MKKYLKTLGLGVVCVGLAGFAVLFFASPYQTLACGERRRRRRHRWGRSGVRLRRFSGRSGLRPPAKRVRKLVARRFFRRQL